MEGCPIRLPLHFTKVLELKEVLMSIISSLENGRSGVEMELMFVHCVFIWEEHMKKLILHCWWFVNCLQRMLLFYYNIFRFDSLKWYIEMEEEINVQLWYSISFDTSEDCFVVCGICDVDGVWRFLWYSVMDCSGYIWRVPFFMSFTCFLSVSISWNLGVDFFSKEWDPMCFRNGKKWTFEQAIGKKKPKKKQGFWTGIALLGKIYLCICDFLREKVSNFLEWRQTKSE